jgi:predicted aspartyl protease
MMLTNMNRPLPRTARRPTLLMAALAIAPTCVLAQGIGGGCNIGETTVLPITFAHGDETPTIPATLAGQPAAAMIDTGAFDSTFYKPALDIAGIAVRESETNYVAADILVANIPSFTVGPISTKGYFNVEKSTESFAARLGANFFARNDVEIWWAGQEVRLTSPKGCRNAYLPAWGPNAHSVPFQTDQSRRDMRAWFKVKINGREVDTVIATTDTISVMDLHTAARYGITPKSPGAVEEGQLPSWRGKQQRVWRVPVADMAIGDYRVQNATIHLMDLTLSGEMMSLGSDFLRNHRVLISMSQRRLYISHLGGPSFSGPPEESPEPSRCSSQTCIVAPE